MRPLQTWKIFLLVFLAILFICGLFPFWSVTHLLSLSASKEDKFSRDYISLLKTADTAQCAALLNPRLQAGSEKNLLQLKDGLNQLGEVKGFHLLNVSYLNIPNSREKIRQLIYYADFEKGSVLFQVALQRKTGGGFWVDLCKYNPLTKPYSESVRFDWAGKSFFQYLYLIGMLLMALFVFYTLFRCLQARLRFKWLWFIFILLGVCKLGMSWDDTSFDFHLFSLQPFSAGVAKESMTDPWTVWIAFPLGAVLFYFFEKQRRDKGLTIGKQKKNPSS